MKNFGNEGRGMMESKNVENVENNEKNLSNKAVDEAKDIVKINKRYSYIVLICSFFLQTLSACMFSTYGTLLVSIVDSTDSKTGFISWFGGIAALSTSITSLFAGPMIDFFGATNTVLCAAIIFLLGHIIATFSSHLPLVIVSLGLSQGLGTAPFQICSFVITTKWFNKSRSFALSFLAGGLGLGMLTWGPLAAYLCDIYGWRGAILLLGALFSHGAILGFFLKDPEKNCEKSLTFKETLFKLFDKELIGNVIFVLYILTIGLVHFSYGVVIALLPRKIVDLGGSNVLGGLIITITGGSSAVLRFLIGIFADKPYFNIEIVYMSSVIVSAICSICTIFTSNITEFIIFSVIFGSASGV